MKVQRRFAVATPIPLALHPGAVTAVLHAVTPVISQLGTFSRYGPMPVRPGVLADDSFFSPDRPVSAFQIHEVMNLAPGLTKDVVYPAYFQQINNGLRCRADGAAGTRTWMEFSVRSRRNPISPVDTVSTPSTAAEMEEYELSEMLLVEANSLLMPTVIQSTLDAHRGLCNRLLHHIAHNETSSIDESPTPADELFRR